MAGSQFPQAEKRHILTKTKNYGILWNPKVQYRIHNRSPLVLILSQTNPVHITPSHLYKIHPNIIHLLRLGLPSGLFPSGFPTNNLYAFGAKVIHMIKLSEVTTVETAGSCVPTGYFEANIMYG
jgi:hypothetical protein